MKPTRGNTKQCLSHFEKAICVRDSIKKRKMIADFVGIGGIAVYNWLRQNRLPVGETLIRLRFYLEHQGYEVAELEELPRPIRDAARLFAFRISSLSEIGEIVGYTSSGRNLVDTLLATFCGKQGVSKQKLEQFASFVELYGDRLEEKKQAVPNLVHGNTRLYKTTIDQQTSKVTGNQSVVIESFAGFITAMLPIAEYVLSDSFTANQRTQVRELAAGGKGVSRLSNLLTQLSCEAT